MYSATPCIPQDISAAAIKNIHRRFPDVKGIISDATSIPLNSASFDIVTSQFGVEYAGLNAINETARLVSKKGVLGLLLHIESGIIHFECQQSLSAITRLKKSNFIPYAIELFDTGFKAVDGAERTDYENAGHKLAPAIRELESIMTQYGKHVAGDTIFRLYDDVAQIHQRMVHYAAEDVVNWLSKMQLELQSYEERMMSMTNATIDESTFQDISKNLQKEGFSITTAKPLEIQKQEEKQAIAWILIAKK